MPVRISCGQKYRRFGIVQRIFEDSASESDSDGNEGPASGDELNDNIEFGPNAVDQQRVLDPDYVLDPEDDSGSDNDSDSEDDTPLSELAAWRKAPFERCIPDYTARGFQLNFNVPQSPSPLDFFNPMWPDALVVYITDQTNLYIVQSEKRLKGGMVTELEVRKVLGILMYSSLVALPSMAMYWARDTYQEVVASQMSRNRFMEIIPNLHFNDNSIMPQRDSPQYDKLYKIRPIIDRINCAFQSAVDPDEYQSIDEMMVKYSGRHSIKQYMPGKPIKYGYKLWARCSSRGYVYWIECYEGRKHAPPPESQQTPGSRSRSRSSAEQPGSSMAPPPPTPSPVPGLGASVVCSAVRGLPSNTKVYFDNFFCSIPLLRWLKAQNYWAVATIRKNRTEKCPLPSDKDLAKRGRGAMEHFVDSKGDIVCVAWYDNKPVLFASNYLGPSPAEQVERFDKSEKARIKVDCPKLLGAYNKHMGGVDIADQIVALYPIRFRSKTWYRRIFYRCLDMAVCNAWLAYRHHLGNPSSALRSSLFDFKMALAKYMLAQSAPPPLPTAAVFRDGPPPSKRRRERDEYQATTTEGRFDGYNHWPTLDRQTSAKRCKYDRCSIKTQWKCDKCQIHLCNSAKAEGGFPCFAKYHEQ